MLEFIEWLKVVFLGIVEGITEWLPISSTGHMLLVDEFIKLNVSDAFKEMFFVVIQLGAILAVVVIFWNKMWPFQMPKESQSIIKKDRFSLWFKVVVSCIPGAVVTLLFDDYVEAHFHTPVVIAIALIFYGIAFIIIENKNKKGVLLYAIFNWCISGAFNCSRNIPFRLNNHRWFVDGNIKSCYSGIYIFYGSACNVWLKCNQNNKIWI